MDDEGKPVRQAERDRYASYARRGKREELQPSTSANAEKPKKQPKTKKEVAAEPLDDKPSSYPKPDDGPDVPVPTESRLRAEQRRAMKTKTSRKIRVRRADSVIRKPTQPSLPVCRRVRAAVSAPPKMSTSARTGPSKRRLEMAPSVRAKKVACRHHKSSREIAEELSSSYGMPETERRMNENIIRGMRAAQRQFCQHIRKNLPLDRTAEDVDRFLSVMEAEMPKS